MYFSEDHEMFRQSLRKFLQVEVVPHIDDWEARGELPRDIWRKFGGQGYFALGMPEAYGGVEGDFFYTVVFLEELSKCRSGGFAAAISAHPILALTHIAIEGSDALKERYLRPGIAGQKFGCLAITEPGAGSDVANIRTRAERAGEEYLINGSKTFITNGVLSDFLVVAVKTDPEAGFAGISLIVVDRDSPGLSATGLDKLGWRASDTGEIAFDNVRVPASHLLGQEGQGFFYIMQRFQLERLVMAVSAVAGAQDALDYALGYMAEREAFGRKINRFQALRHRVAGLAAEIEMTRTFVYHCCRLHNDGRFAVKECSMAKLLATELSDKVTYECLQFLGGNGYMEDYPLARMWRDSRLGTIGGGTSEIMREIIAKMVIDGKAYGGNG